MDRLISEQAVIDSIEFFQMNPQHFDFVNLIDDIKEIPSAEPKTGHWIFDEILDKHYYCSECKSMGVTYWDYCPYCGTKMIEPNMSEIPTSSKPEISSFYGLRSYVGKRSDKE